MRPTSCPTTAASTPGVDMMGDREGGRGFGRNVSGFGLRG